MATESLEQIRPRIVPFASEYPAQFPYEGLCLTALWVSCFRSLYFRSFRLAADSASEATVLEVLFMWDAAHVSTHGASQIRQRVLCQESTLSHQVPGVK
ncbi:hypothetical protein EVAR_31592_1 [Eumeta japonica]|uniref:Uncharacterized protein n=1 Tax=Eumeta variegata TaxID=151549 RepID=A0A4C1VYN4_EUMVA|nr:hypothetical protein EVAR_31592_1 [Eumeta japonica]